MADKSLETASRNELADAAQRAFVAGYQDRENGRPRLTGPAVLTLLGLDSDRRYQQDKIRQCYGAGYDFAHHDKACGITRW